MMLTDATLGLLVSSLGISGDWHKKIFGLGVPALEPADGVVEFKLGQIWLQLWQDPTAPYDDSGIVLRSAVDDVAREQKWLTDLGVAVGVLSTTRAPSTFSSSPIRTARSELLL